MLGASLVVVMIVAVVALGKGRTPQPTAAPPLSTSTTSTALATTSTTTGSTTSSTTLRTSTSLAPPTTTTTTLGTTITTLAPLVLDDDGLGVAQFGDGIDETLAVVGARLGSVTADSGWVAARGTFGVCPGTVVRVVRWDSLRLFFSDGPTDFADEGYHFFYYSQSPVETDILLDLTTAAGIGIDSSVADLRSAYRDRLVIESTIPFGVTFYVEADTPGLLSGILSSSSPDGVVTAISGGFGCGT
jgi:hypothetical protein